MSPLRPTLFRSALVFGILGSTLASSGLDKWGHISAIAGSAIAAVLFVAGIARAVYHRWLHAPQFEVKCGNADPFRKARRTRQERHHAIDSDNVPHTVHETRLRVYAALGRDRAEQVSARIVRTSIAPDEWQAHMAALHWTGDHRELDLLAGDHGYLKVAEYVTDQRGEDVKAESPVRGLQPGARVTFVVSLLVRGKSKGEWAFVADWGDAKTFYPKMEEVPL